MQELTSKIGSSVIDLYDVQRSYRRWAPIYDITFG